MNRFLTVQKVSWQRVGKPAVSFSRSSVIACAYMVFLFVCLIKRGYMCIGVHIFIPVAS